jgi:thiamine monophosphate synthase
VAVVTALFDSADIRATARAFSRLFETAMPEPHHA